MGIRHVIISVTSNVIMPSTLQKTFFPATSCRRWADAVPYYCAVEEF